jgi:uncharacterized protein (TIGR03437 family)
VGGTIALGSIQFTIPGSATGGQSYTVAFTNAQGSLSGSSVSITYTGAGTSSTVNVATALSVTGPVSLSVGTVGVAYPTTTATASGGVSPYTFSATGLAGSGLSISGAGAITGTPTTAGPYTVVVKVTDSASNTATRSYSLTIYAALTVSGPASLPAGTVTFAYPATTVTASGGSGSYTWSATGLPGGMSIGPTTGIISGTPPSTGAFSVTVTVNDTASNSANKSYSITVNPAPSISGPASLPLGTASFPYTNTTITATGGTAPLTWSATGLPGGLSIGPGTGIISGTPATNTGTPFSVQVTVTDANSASATKAYSLSVNPALVITSPASLPVGIPSVVYTTTTITASGGSGAPFTWAASGLPTGLSINASTGVISGTPANNNGSPYSVQITVTDSSGLVYTTRTYTLIVAPPLSITGPASLPSAVVNTSYAPVPVTATGGSGSYSFSETGLPPGLTISAGGAISGTPSSLTGTPFNVVVTVTDTNGTTATKSYSLAVSALPLTIVTGLLPAGVLNAVYPRTSINVQGGIGAYTFTVTGLPPGLTTDGSGNIFGTPTSTAGSPFTVKVTVTDATGNTTSQTYSLTISGVLSVAAPSTLPSATLNSPYPSTTVTAGGGLAPYTWTATGLPTGLTINLTSGTISGTPTSGSGSPYSVVVTVTDSTGAHATMSYTLVVNSPLTISAPASLLAGTAGTAYTAVTVTATGGSGVYTWSATGMPSGMTIAATTGIISGILAANTAGSYTVVVTVTDTSAATATKSYSLTINPGVSTVPLIASVSNAAGGQAQVAPNTWVSVYGSNFAPAGFTDTWSTHIVNGNLPILLDGVSVTVGGQAAYVSYVSAVQINVLLPNVGFGMLPVTVTTTGGTSAAYMVASQQYSPAFFPWPNSQPVATHLDYTEAVAAGTFPGTTTIPAAPGETIVLWGTGFGPTTPAAPLGVAIPTTATYNTSSNVVVMLNGAPLTVYQNVATLAPGFAGLFQIGVTVPASLANGAYPIAASINGVTSPTLTLTVHN